MDFPLRRAFLRLSWIVLIAVAIGSALAFWWLSAPHQDVALLTGYLAISGALAIIAAWLVAA